MQVKVLQHHIDEGVRKDGFNCAVALALREAIPAAEGIFVGMNILVDAFTVSKTPPDVLSFIELFDSRKPVAPFTFELDYTPRKA